MKSHLLPRLELVEGISGCYSRPLVAELRHSGRV